jgi:hypothetical protein
MEAGRTETGEEHIMRRWTFWTVALTGLTLIMTGNSHGVDEKSKKSEADAKQRLTPAGQILGEVIKVEEGGKSFTLRLHEKTPQINYNNSFQRPGGYQSYRNAASMFRRGNVSFKDSHTDVDIMLAEDPKVRIPFRPEIDEKTKKVKPESVRPDPNDPDRKLGGLAGFGKDLQRGQWVLVTLGATRDKPPQYQAMVVQVVSEPQQKQGEKR